MAHILAIDDDEAMLILIKNALRKDGHEVERKINPRINTVQSPHGKA